ncbi:uncharacterized protein LOC132795335 [Drosophila nasuta]|uniref:uncharacterized protein LOC132795335 n=1 Tax=Drosophila nasuta TaxID=42062 RepID=UPI00295E427C|nr:uncharacterized protein LOC132795335 [Drosophila nasuta]
MHQLITYREDEAYFKVKYVTTIWMSVVTKPSDAKEYLVVVLQKAMHINIDIIYSFPIQYFYVEIDWEQNLTLIDCECVENFETDFDLQKFTQLKFENQTFVEVDIVSVLEIFIDSNPDISLLSYLEAYLRAIYDNNLAIEQYLANFHAYRIDTESDIELAKYLLNLFNYMNIDDDYEFMLKCDQELESIEEYVESLSEPEIQSILESISSEELILSSRSDLEDEFERDLEPKCLRTELLQYVLRHAENYFQMYLKKIVEAFSEEFVEQYIREYLDKRMLKYLEASLDINLNAYLNLTFNKDWETYLSTSLLTDFDTYVNTYMKADIELYLNIHLSDDLSEHLQVYIDTFLKLRLMPALTVDKVDVETTSESSSQLSNSDNNQLEVFSLFELQLMAIQPQFAYVSFCPLVGMRFETDLSALLTIVDWVQLQRYLSHNDSTYNPIVFLRTLHKHYEMMYFTLSKINASILLWFILLFVFILILIAILSQ